MCYSLTVSLVFLTSLRIYSWKSTETACGEVRWSFLLCMYIWLLVHVHVLADTLVPNRATAHDIITHRNRYKIHFRMARLSRDTNMYHSRAIVTTLLEFLYKWMPLHLVYTIATLVCEETWRWTYKVSDQAFEFAMQKWSENDVIAVAL